ncbi:MAG: NAD kinase [Bacteroidales bacterium]|nr:NAD kinase [Bacteroidales bacterium]
MNVALFGKTLTDAGLPVIQELVDLLDHQQGRTFIYQPFYQFLLDRITFKRDPSLFVNQAEIENKVDVLFSIGGDGTILDAIGLVGDSGIPVTGINLGRLGFLSGISKEQIIPAIQDIQNGQYQIEKRTLLSLDAPEKLFGSINFALNDITVHKTNVMSMLTIKIWINGEFLNAYWADGLIVATPTGSTAYSLSCNGPVITPDSENFLITPIASHNLTVRPIIIRDDSEIRIRIEGKNSEYMVSLDSRIEQVDHTVELIIRKAAYKINLLRLKNKDFFQTIREKLNWGLDNRN